MIKTYSTKTKNKFITINKLNKVNVIKLNK